ncbi:MAG TPA: hypothetical protein VFH51_05215, partial [Myxococcota bacterium]|nr:hypothetical protein [Myxococcota bacterium]
MGISLQDQKQIKAYVDDIKTTLNKQGFRERQAADIAGLKDVVWRNKDAFTSPQYDAVMNNLTRLNSDILQDNGATTFNSDVSQLLGDLTSVYEKPTNNEGKKPDTSKEGKPDRTDGTEGEDNGGSSHGAHGLNDTIIAYSKFADDFKAKKSPEALKKDIDAVARTVKGNKDFDAGRQRVMIE